MTGGNAVYKYFDYRFSRGIAMNMLFTMSAMKKEEEVMDYMRCFYRRLSIVYKTPAKEPTYLKR